MKETAVAFNVVPVVPFVGPFSWVAIGAIVSLMLGVWWGKMDLDDNEKAPGGFKACDMGFREGEWERKFSGGRIWWRRKAAKIEVG